MLLAQDTMYHVHLGDCIEHMYDMPAASVDMSVFSPPFPQLFSYTSQAADIGNSEGMRGEAKLHLGYFYRGLRRVLKPGRSVVVHVMQIPRLKRSVGVVTEAKVKGRTQTAVLGFRRGDIRSMDERYLELAQMVGESAFETPEEGRDLTGRWIIIHKKKEQDEEAD